MKRSQSQRIIDWLNRTDAEREMRNTWRNIIVFAALLLFACVITGCGTYCWTSRTETAQAPETTQAPEHHDAGDDLLVAVRDINIDPPAAIDPEDDPDAEYITFRVSAYCPCAYCCGTHTGITYSGEPAVEGVTVGADLDVLPIGSVVYIEGYGQRTVQDTGNFKGYKLDLYFENHADAVAFGVQTLDVKVLKIGG